MSHAFDLVIRNGTLADGTGAALREGDIAIQNGFIASVGTISGSGREEIDATGMLVTPGLSTSIRTTTGRSPGKILSVPLRITV